MFLKGTYSVKESNSVEILIPFFPEGYTKFYRKPVPNFPEVKNLV